MSIDSPRFVARTLAKLERLPIFGLTVAVLFGSLFLKYIHDVDMYWQLQLGEILWRTGRFPATEPFLFGKGDVPHIPICWLAQLIDYGVWTLGGWPLLQLFDGAVWIGGYAAVAWKLRRQGTWAWPAALALLYGFLPSYTYASIRPQSFALLGFGLMMVLTWTPMKLWKKLLLGAILFVIWQNAHPSVLTAGAWLGPLTIGAVVRWWRRPQVERGAFPWDLLGLSVFAVASSFACPYPLSTFELARANEQMSKFLDVSEWKPLFWDALAPMGQYGLDARGSAILALAILPVLVAVRWRRMKLEEVICALVLAAFTWQMYRFACFLGFALIPLAYRALAPVSAVSPPPLVRSWKWLLAGAFAIAIAISLTRFAIAEAAKPDRTPVDPHMHYFPFEAVARMKTDVPPGTVVTDFFWGGVAARGGYPNWKVSHDGRYYLFSRDEWDWYWAAMSQQCIGGFTVTLDDVVKLYNPVAFLLHVGPDDGLIAKLDDPDSGWKRLGDSFDRGQAVVFVPR